MQTSTPAAQERRGLSNIMRNLGWLLGGKGYAGVVSLVYLAILSRSLGLKDFGHFSLIFGTAQALVAVSSFEIWQTVVRYGMPYRIAGDWTRFGRVVWLTTAIDIAGALVGTVVAIVIYWGFAEILELNPEYINAGLAFSCTLLWTRMTTPFGIVRVLDRFDIGSYVEAIAPTGRLIAACAIAFVAPSVKAFLTAWAVLEIIAAIAYWIAASRLAPQALTWSNFGQWRQTIAENEGIRGFFGVTYASSTLDAIYRQGPLLAVGYFLGTSAAGLYRLADQLAQGIGKFAQIATRAVFPEFAMARAASEVTDFARLVRSVTAIAGVGGVLVSVLALVAGEQILVAVGGSEFARGASVLVPIAIGASFELAAVSYEPVLYSTGNARYPLMIRMIAVTVLGIGIVTLVPLGPIGVGIAVACGMAVLWVLMSVTVWRVMRGLVRAETNA